MLWNWVLNLLPPDSWSALFLIYEREAESFLNTEVQNQACESQCCSFNSIQKVGKEIGKRLEGDGQALKRT